MGKMLSHMFIDNISNYYDAITFVFFIVEIESHVNPKGDMSQQAKWVGENH